MWWILIIIVVLALANILAKFMICSNTDEKVSYLEFIANILSSVVVFVFTILALLIMVLAATGGFTKVTGYKLKTPPPKQVEVVKIISYKNPCDRSPDTSYLRIDSNRLVPMTSGGNVATLTEFP